MTPEDSIKELFYEYGFREINNHGDHFIYHNDTYGLKAMRIRRKDYMKNVLRNTLHPVVLVSKLENKDILEFCKKKNIDNSVLEAIKAILNNAQKDIRHWFSEADKTSFVIRTESDAIKFIFSLYCKKSNKDKFSQKQEFSAIFLSEQTKQTKDKSQNF